MGWHGEREKRTRGNDARTDVEKKKDEEISGSIFDPEKGAALPEEMGGRGGDGGGQRGRKRKVRKRKRVHSENLGLHFEGTYNGEAFYFLMFTGTPATRIAESSLSRW